MTPPGLGFLYRLLVLGGVERGWDVELPEDLGFSARVWAVEYKCPGHFPPVGRAMDPPLGLRLAADGLEPDFGYVETTGLGLGWRLGLLVLGEGWAPGPVWRSPLL